RSEQSEYVERVLVSDAVMVVDALSDLVDLGDQEPTRTGDPHRNLSSVRGVESRDRSHVAVDERSLKTPCATRRSLTVWSKPCAARAGPGEGLGNHDADGDAIRAEPGTRVALCRKTRLLELIAEQRRIREHIGRDGEVRVRRVLGNGKIGVTSVQVDRLRSHEDDSIEVRAEGLDGVEERTAGADVERVKHARNPRSTASTRGARFPPTVHARDRSVSRRPAARRPRSALDREWSCARRRRDRRAPRERRWHRRLWGA